MIRFFRLGEEEGSPNSSLKISLFVFLIVLIVGSFFLQMSMGICPVP